MDLARGVARIGAGLALLATAGVVAAHETGDSRFDAPIPLPLLYLGAGLTVLATAAWLGYADGRPEQSRWELATVSVTTGRRIRGVARAGFLLAALAAAVHGVFGKQAAAENLATLFVWPVWVDGLALLSVAVGSPWRWLSPWATIHAALERLEGGSVAILGTYPAWLGHWPALIGFLSLVGVAGNLTVLPRDPALTTAAVGVYGLAMIVGSIAFGRAWLERADPLGVFYDLLGRVAPLTVLREARQYRIALRAPWADATLPVVDRTLVAFVVAAVYTVSFDGVTATETYRTASFATRSVTGTGPAASVLLYFAGLVGFLGSFAAAAVLSDRFAGVDLETVTADGGTTRRDGPLPGTVAFAGTVVPIAAAYEVAHDYPYVAGNAGRTVSVVLDLVVGVAPTLDPLWWLPVPAYWASQVALVVGGHVVAVVAAHAVVTDRYGSIDAARRGHLPLVAVMVAYTVISLWIVSRPVVAG